jgi:RNA polymerase sigma-70 factor (ECF subfamily)
MNATASIFESHRSRLLSVAYRMLGGNADAEDLVQDAYLRWHQSSSSEIGSPVAFLVTVTKRLCLDRLRELKSQRITYFDGDLPEPTAEGHAPSPEARLEGVEGLSEGFLQVLERLGTAERATFLLHDIFDYDHHEVARTLGKSEQACRQTLHRARERLREPRARFSVAPDSREYQGLFKAFLAAVDSGEREAVAALLAGIFAAGSVAPN